MFGSRIKVKDEDLTKYKLPENRDTSLKELLSFVYDNLCTSIIFGFDCELGFNSNLGLSQMVIYNNTLYFIAEDEVDILRENILKLDRVDLALVEILDSKSRFTDLIGELERQNLNLKIGFGLFAKNKEGVYLADEVMIGSDVIVSLQEKWLRPEVLLVWGIFKAPRYPDYSLSFNKAREYLLKGKKIARSFGAEEIVYFLDGEYIYEEFRDQVSLTKLSKSFLTSKFRLIDEIE